MRFNFFLKKKNRNLPALLSFKKRGNKKKALVIYAADAVKQLYLGNYREENFNSHSMHWETVEMVRLLNENGYDVDYADCTVPLSELNWDSYQLIIDERNHFYNRPKAEGQTRIFYATGCRWDFQNAAEEKRLQAFQQRTGLHFFPQRKIEELKEESVADVVTYFGGDFQQQLFTNPDKTFPLSLSSSFIPSFKTKDAAAARNHFLWLGSRGFIHKGLDIVLEAFEKSRSLQLHICAHLEAEPDFFNWFNVRFGSAENIIYHGFKNVSDPSFIELAESCIGTVYCSASEGGAGAVIQAMQFGCIPFTNRSTALRGAHTGFIIEGDEADELIINLDQALNKMHEHDDEFLQQRSAEARKYANENHSKQAYSESFQQLLSSI